MARFDRDLLESAPLQLVPVANPDLAERVAGAVVPVAEGRFARLQRVVYAGIYLNEIARVDLPQSSFIADFYLWLRSAAPPGGRGGRERDPVPGHAPRRLRSGAARRSAATCRTARSTASGTCAASSATSSTCTASPSTGRPWRCACSTRAPPRTASSTRSTGARRRWRLRRPAAAAPRVVRHARRRRPAVGQPRRVPRPDAVAGAPDRGAAGRAGHPLRARRPAADRRRAGPGALGLPLRGGPAPADGAPRWSRACCRSG